MTRLLTARLTASVVLLGIFCAVPLCAAEPEDELKAAIVLTFLRYTEGPQLARDGPLTICVIGRSSFAQVLKRTLDGKPVSNRSVQVIDMNATYDPRRCQAVYFATENRPQLRETVPLATAARALTIGESKDFLDTGGAINLLTVDGRMSFEVDLGALDRAGLSISSKLLRVGQVRGHRKGDSS